MQPRYCGEFPPNNSRLCGPSRIGGQMADILFPPLTVSRKTGQEVFRNGTSPLSIDLLAFWQWAASDLVSNALRGRLAEFLVAQAMGIADGVRTEWDAYDLL